MANKIKLPKNYMRRLASKGRFGDTELVHVNKAEEKILADITGRNKLERNPNTGLKEAPFPWLVAGAVAKGLGSLIGGSMGKKTSTKSKRSTEGC